MRLTVLVLLLAWVPMMATKAADDAAPAQQARVFEMRTYIANEGKFEALQKRFRDHTVKLFEKHGMTNVGYFVPRSEADGKGQTLIYILAYPSAEAAKASWAAFGADPEWKAVKAESEKDGVLVKQVISVYLDPTDYSAIK